MNYKHIIHIQFTGPYTEGLSYQENILPKYQKNENNIVEFWALNYALVNGKEEKVPICDKMMPDGVRLRRFELKKHINEAISQKVRDISNIEKELEIANPDFIMIHDVQSITMFQISRFCRKHTNTRVVVDCHADFNNSAKNILSRVLLHELFYRKCAKCLLPYVDKFYGTLPGRVTFLEKVYAIPKEKCSLLVMGADDTLIKRAKSREVRKNVRERYDIGDYDFLIVTGGKIDHNRGNEVLKLMRVIRSLNVDNIKLLIFGLCHEEYEEEFNSLLCDRVKFAGWVNSEETYSYMASAELAVFPGLHSVMWEQAVAVGTPCLFRDIEGFHHVDLGGNAKFIKIINEENLKEVILEIYHNKEEYKKMKKVADSKGPTVFSYSMIAKKCLDIQ